MSTTRRDETSATLNGVQSHKVRRVKEKLFLHEMERLADEMCRHYIDVRTQVSAVPPKDLRQHVDLIHTKVDKVVADELSVTAQDPKSWIDQFKGAKPLNFGANDSVHPPSGTGTTGGGWTAQESRGVSLRLRRMQPFVPKPKNTLSGMNDVEFGSAQRDASEGLSARGPSNSRRNRQHLIDEDETPAFVVKRFAGISDDANQMVLLDMNMDGNTSCLSARRPKKFDPHDPHAVGQRKLAATIPKPLPEFRPFERTRMPTPPELRTNFQPERSDQERTMNIASTVAGERLQSGTWSARDRMIMKAMDHRQKGFSSTTSSLQQGKPSVNAGGVQPMLM